MTVVGVFQQGVEIAELVQLIRQHCRCAVAENDATRNGVISKINHCQFRVTKELKRFGMSFP